MSNNPETVRKRNAKKNETAAQRDARRARDRERNRQKRANQSDEVREEHLASERIRKKRRRERRPPKNVICDRPKTEYAGAQHVIVVRCGKRQLSE